MDKYRIKEIEFFGGLKSYKVQKRFLGFLWWHDFRNGDGFETGTFINQEDAEKAIEVDMWKDKVRIVKTYRGTEHIKR